jgi:hypothetical protein
MRIITSVSLSGENHQHTAAVPRKMFNLAHVNFAFSGNLAPGPFGPARSFNGSRVDVVRGAVL